MHSVHVVSAADPSPGHRVHIRASTGIQGSWMGRQDTPNGFGFGVFSSASQMVPGAAASDDAQPLPASPHTRRDGQAGGLIKITLTAEFGNGWQAQNHRNKRDG